MTKWIFTIALAALLAGCAELTGDLGQQCFDVLKHKLPPSAYNSAKIYSHYVDEGDVIVIYTYGADRLGSFECLLRDGAVSKYGTLTRELKDKGKS
ncbi:MAG: hypothetical protein RPU39_00325 [Candidatus Sedimenticola sp. (ex Thyasira tokunagai)]